MTSKLKDGTINVAVALTEGLTAGIANGQDWYKIVGTYVSAPLCMISYYYLEDHKLQLPI